MKSFKNKAIMHNPRHAHTPGSWAVVKSLSTILMIIVIIGLGRWALWHGITWMKAQLGDVLKSGIGVIWSTIGTEVEEDDMGQISVLLVGIGGEWHRGTYNTDTMMVASYSPATKAVTFISVPRDLYVNIDTNWNGRINAILNAHINQWVSITGALTILTNKVSTIMGIPINHYVLIDFEWFEKMIDTLWGITVNVPETIVDYSYPLDEYRTMTLTINSGTQVMNGDLALKYARSRHTTSDFDRALRQQLIIQWVFKQLVGWGWLLKIKELRQDFEAAVTTDLDYSQLLWLAKYLNRIDHYFSFVLQWYCNDYYKLTYPGCLLYAPNSAAFGWAAILLPVGATASRISYYNNIQQFAYYTIYQQPFLIENARVVLWNWIDKDQLLPGQNPNGVTSELATQLVNYGFNVAGIGNNRIKSTTSQLIKVGSGDYDITADLLKDFAPVNYSEVIDLSTLSGTIFSGNSELDINLSWVDLILIIGNDYLSRPEE